MFIQLPRLSLLILCSLRSLLFNFFFFLIRGNLPNPRSSAFYFFPFRVAVETSRTAAYAGTPFTVSSRHARAATCSRRRSAAALAERRHGPVDRPLLLPRR